MGEILNYYNDELKKIDEDKVKKFPDKFKSANIKNRTMRELSGLFTKKLEEAKNFKPTIKKVDDNIDKLESIDAESPMYNSLQKAVFNEINVFQTISKPNCLGTMEELEEDLEKIKTKMSEAKESLKVTKKKSVGDRILNFFGLGKKNKDKNEDKIQDKEKIKNRKEILKEIEFYEKEIASTEQELKNSIETLNKAKTKERILKNSQQNSFGIMTRKSLKNAIYNPTNDKRTGMIGCLTQVYDILDRNYLTTASIANLNRSSKYETRYEPFSTEGDKYNTGIIRYARDMLVGCNPKHFKECKRKLEDFSNINIDSLFDKRKITFDMDEFEKLKENLKTSMNKTFGEIPKMVNSCLEELKNIPQKNINKALLKTYAKKIYNKKRSLVKEYTNMKKDFTKKVKNLIPKYMTYRDKIANLLASLALFNCSIGENKVLIDYAAVRRSCDIECKIAATSAGMIVVAVSLVAAMLTVAAASGGFLLVLSFVGAIHAFVTSPVIFTTVESMRILDYYEDLDAISGSIIKKSREAKQ